MGILSLTRVITRQSFRMCVRLGVSLLLLLFSMSLSKRRVFFNFVKESISIIHFRIIRKFFSSYYLFLNTWCISRVSFHFWFSFPRTWSRRVGWGRSRLGRKRSGRWLGGRSWGGGLGLGRRSWGVISISLRATTFHPPSLLFIDIILAVSRTSRLQLSSAFVNYKEKNVICK